VADEHVCHSDSLIEELPDVVLRSALCHGQVTSDLDVTSIEYWTVWRQVLSTMLAWTLCRFCC
jgi:hypothetical protein